MLPGVPWPPIAGPRPAPKSQEQIARIWSLELDDIEASLRELWLFEYRWQGSGRARGSFALDPARSVWVTPSHVTLDSGALSAGDTRISRRLRAQLDATLTPVEAPRVNRRQMLRALSGRARVEVQADDLQFAQLYSPSLSAKGHGALVADGQLVRGKLAPGSTVALQLPEVSVRSNGTGFQGTLAVAVGLDSQPQAHAVARGTVLIALPRAEPLRVSAPQLELAAWGSTIDLTQPLALVRLEGQAVGPRADDARPLLKALGRRLPLYVPPLLGNGPLEVGTVRIEGDALSRLQLSAESVRWGDAALQADAVLRGGALDAALFGTLARLRLGVRVQGNRARVKLFARDDWLRAQRRALQHPEE